MWRQQKQQQGAGAWRDFEPTGDESVDYVGVWPLVSAGIIGAHRSDTTSWANAMIKIGNDLPHDWRVGLLAWYLGTANISTRFGRAATPSELDALSKRWASRFHLITNQDSATLRGLLYAICEYPDSDRTITPGEYLAFGFALLGITMHSEEDVRLMRPHFRKWYESNPDRVQRFVSRATEHRRSRGLTV